MDIRSASCISGGREMAIRIAFKHSFMPVINCYNQIYSGSMKVLSVWACVKICVCK